MCRNLFIVEFILLGLPSLIVLGGLAIIFGGISGLVLLVESLTSLGGGVMDVLPILLGFPAAICGLFALFYFGRASLRYMGDGATGLLALRDDLPKAALLAFLPVAYMMWVAFGTDTLRFADPVALFYLSGAAIIIPALHLTFASRMAASLPGQAEPSGTAHEPE